MPSGFLRTCLVELQASAQLPQIASVLQLGPPFPSQSRCMSLRQPPACVAECPSSPHAVMPLLPACWRAASLSWGQMSVCWASPPEAASAVAMNPHRLSRERCCAEAMLQPGPWSAAHSQHKTSSAKCCFASSRERQCACLVAYPGTRVSSLLQLDQRSWTGHCHAPSLFCLGQQDLEPLRLHLATRVPSADTAAAPIAAAPLAALPPVLLSQPGMHQTCGVRLLRLSPTQQLVSGRKQIQWLWQELLHQRPLGLRRLLKLPVMPPHLGAPLSRRRCARERLAPNLVVALSHCFAALPQLAASPARLRASPATPLATAALKHSGQRLLAGNRVTTHQLFVAAPMWQCLLLLLRAPSVNCLCPSR
mmetsp:Transcript_53515/g.127578  ORF Transcript_53515/g.127578 Transcript_53515/m.127578 type:complete len:364 (+) Transcript_53515:357-1448(+)